MTDSTAIPPSVRRGFTLTELLVVLLVIAVLAAIITVGISGVIGGTEGKSTRVRLEAMTTLLANYERNNAGSVGAGAESSANRLPNSLSPATPIAVPAARAGLESRGADDALDPDEPGFDADNQYARTRLVLKRLLRVPANRAAFDDLPTEARGMYAADDDVPVVVDAFDGVILHVPPAGLTGMNWEAFDDGDEAGYVVVARDGRGFFASAGNDGSFENADDNLYSADVVILDGPGGSPVAIN